MTNIRVCLEQVRRLRVTKYFGTLDEESISELAKMLTFAENEIISVAVVNQWLEEQVEKPTPADLRRLVAFHNEARQAEIAPAPRLAYKCAACEDSGLRGGDVGPEGQPWSLCDCEASKNVDLAELDKMNTQWRRLRLLTERPTTKRTGKLLNVGEVYRDV